MPDISQAEYSAADQMKDLAELKAHPGFIVLCNVLKAYEEGLLEQMEVQADVTRMVRLQDTWRIFRTIRKAVESAPESAQVNYENFLESAGMDEDVLEVDKFLNYLPYGTDSLNDRLVVD